MKRVMAAPEAFSFSRLSIERKKERKWVLLKCEIRLISRNQIDFAKSDLTEMRIQSKLYNNYIIWIEFAFQLKLISRNQFDFAKSA